MMLTNQMTMLPIRLIQIPMDNRVERFVHRSPEPQHAGRTATRFSRSHSRGIAEFDMVQ